MPVQLLAQIFLRRITFVGKIEGRSTCRQEHELVNRKDANNEPNTRGKRKYQEGNLGSRFEYAHTVNDSKSR